MIQRDSDGPMGIGKAEEGKDVGHSAARPKWNMRRPYDWGTTSMGRVSFSDLRGCIEVFKMI